MSKEKPTTKLCKHCKTEIPFDAKVCPNCRKKQGASGCLIVIVVLIVLGALGALGGGGDKNTKPDSKNNQPVITETDNPEETVDQNNESVNPPEPESNVTMGQKNALSKARDYLNFSAFSYSGLIHQLEFEGFSNEEATYAVDNCGADWNEQAALKAQEYLDFSSFSRSGLIEQLEFEGFTAEQAEYGVQAVGY